MKQYVLPELPYDYAALEPHYSPRLLELHHNKHHAAYVAGANTTVEKLAEAREKNDFAAINQLEKNLAFHLSGHVLHSLFWRNLSPRGGGEPERDLADAVRESFGSFKGLRSQLEQAALNIQGSGWGTVSWEPVGRRLVVEQVYDHQGNTGNGTVPLLVLDMWEHAYYLQYLTEKKDWVAAFLEDRQLGRCRGAVQKRALPRSRPLAPLDRPIKGEKNVCNHYQTASSDSLW